jgi:1,4-alpha-glucan branching enzyme
MKQGAFTFVLHSHLPYCRRAGRWPHGEEWIHEAASETYLPLLNALHDLVEEGVKFKLTIGLTPVLVEQLADDLVKDHFDEYLADELQRAEDDEKRYRGTADPRERLARWYAQVFRDLQRSFQERYGRDIPGAFRRLQDEGYVEIATSAATHGYLPLLDRDSTIYGQLKTGVDSYRRHFGRPPRSIWLPECAYRPSYRRQDNGHSYIKPGLEKFLAELGLKVFFSETHTVEGGLPVGKAMGDAVGPYGDIPRRYVVPPPQYTEPTERTTYQPYWVQSLDVAVIGRNNRTGMQVWSADHGYPGDFAYREFHKKDGTSGLQYWRVTGARVDLGYKDFYDPAIAGAAVAGHSRHFAGLVEELIAGYRAESGRYGIISAAYDTELFGHWWFEGVEWIKQVLRHLSRSEVVDLTTAAEFVAEHPPTDVLALPESSWGQGGGHFTWLNVDTEWMWPTVHESELRMERIVARYPNPDPTAREVLRQLAREKLLLESSDWPFLVTTGQAREYAETRFQQHAERFDQLATLLEAGSVDEGAAATAREWYECDKLFPEIDVRAFGDREAIA